MSKFCAHCGSTLADNATFCPNCGAPANAQPQQQQPSRPVFQQTNTVGAAAKPGMSKNAKLAIIIAAAVVAVGLIVWLIIALVGGGYQKPIDNYIKALEDRDVELFTDSMTPGGDLGALVGSFSTSSIKSTYTTRLKSLINKYGEDFKIDYEIVEKEEVPESETLGLYDGCYKLKIEFGVIGSKKEATVTKNVTVAKSGGKWFLGSAISL